MPFVVTYEWDLDDFDDERQVDVEAVAFTREEAESFIRSKPPGSSANYEILDVPLAFS